jgi:hypothetical protein
MPILVTFGIKLLTPIKETVVCSESLQLRVELALHPAIAIVDVLERFRFVKPAV